MDYGGRYSFSCRQGVKEVITAFTRSQGDSFGHSKNGKFQEEKGLNSQEKSSIGTMAEPDRQAVKKVVTEVELRALEDILAHVASQTTKEEQEYIAEENIQNQVQKDHIDLQRKFSLMEATQL